MQFEVTSTVKVELREEAFTESFMQEFSSYMSEYETLEEHAENIAQLVAREVIGEIDGKRGSQQFVEGYGVIGTFVKTALIRSFEIQPDDAVEG